MKNKIIFVMSVTVLFVFIAEVGSAQELEKKFALGARAGFYQILDDDMPQGEITSSATAYGEANLTYFFVDYFSLELSGGYVKPDLDLKQNATGYVVEYGEIKQIPFLLTARFHWWSDIPKVGLYAGGGVGYFVNDFTVSDTFISLNPGVSVDADNSFGALVALGVEYFITTKWALSVDFKYIYNPVDFLQTQPGVSPLAFDLNLNTFIGVVGIKYFF
ncbi:MAG: OmpW family outer membrane protein [Desulfobacteraceae bacterium]|jgi:outer membrane protein W